MDQLKKFASGFKAPDWSKILYGRDSVDGANVVLQEKSLFQEFEAYLIRIQELGLWLNPAKSMVALFAFHFGFLVFTSGTVLNTLAWGAIIGFVYLTWTRRIWPEIRVEEIDKEEDFTPMNPDCLTAPELNRAVMGFTSKVKDTLSRFWTLRSAEPGKFCIMSSGVFLTLGFFGMWISLSGLIYYSTVAILTLPGLIKYLRQFPQCKAYLDSMAWNPSDAVDGGAEVKVEVKEEQPLLQEENKGYMESLVQQGQDYVGNLINFEEHSNSNSMLPTDAQMMPDPQDLVDEPDGEEQVMREMDEFLPSQDDENISAGLSHHGNQDQETEGSEDFDLSKASDEASSESELPRTTMMLESAIEDEDKATSADKRKPSTSSSSGEGSEEFEQITEEELKLVDI